MANKWGANRKNDWTSFSWASKSLQTVTAAMKLKDELFNLRFQLATGQLENTGRIREVRKGIARMKTIISERENNK